jgi:hypothetical protein
MCVENRNRNPILSSVQNHLESVAALCYPSTLTLDSICAPVWICLSWIRPPHAVTDLDTNTSNGSPSCPKKMPTTRIQVPDTERHPGSALQRLPHELLNNVFQRVSTKDVLALRCTCTNLASVGLDHFGTEVALVSHRDKFRALTEIATHPVLSKRMTSLFYMCDRLHPISFRS